MVVGVPLLGLSVDLHVTPAEGSLHLSHGEGTDGRAAGRSFIPAQRQRHTEPGFFLEFLKTLVVVLYHKRLSPLRGEDAVEDGALPAVVHRLEDEHVLDDVEGEAVVGEGTEELSLQEGGPLLLQHPFTSFIALQTTQSQMNDTGRRPIRREDQEVQSRGGE